jgi:hypothetical protein
VAQYYFAYGADMDIDDLGLRCELRRRGRMRFARSTAGFIKGFSLVCNITSRHRQGGIFNIVPDPAGAVHGVLYELHPGDLISTTLIREGESKSYYLAACEVTTRSGKVHPAVVLCGDAKSKALKPTPSYVDVVSKAAQNHGLPREWIETLRQITQK